MGEKDRARREQKESTSSNQTQPTRDFFQRWLSDLFLLLYSFLLTFYAHTTSYANLRANIRHFGRLVYTLSDLFFPFNVLLFPDLLFYPFPTPI